MMVSDRSICYQLKKALNPARCSVLPIDRGHPPSEQSPGPSNGSISKLTVAPSSMLTNVVEFEVILAPCKVSFEELKTYL